MTDAYFDELGIAWRANIPDTDALMTRLRGRLRRQTFIRRANIFLATVVWIFLITVVLWFWNWGEITWRSTTTRVLLLVILAAYIALTVWDLRGENGDTKNLSNMIDLAISRAERAFRQVRVMYFACAINALFVAAMWFVSPALDRLPADIVHRRLLFYMVFVIVWGGAFTIWTVDRRRRAQDDLAKLKYLKGLLEAE